MNILDKRKPCKLKKLINRSQMPRNVPRRETLVQIQIKSISILILYKNQYAIARHLHPTK